MRILILSARSIRHPLSGGANSYLHEIMRRLVTRYEITVLAGGGPGRPQVETIDGILYRNLTGKLCRILRPAQYAAFFSRSADILVDNADVAFPWLTPLYSRKPTIAMIYQVNGQIFHSELNHVLADMAIRCEQFMGRVYRRTTIVTCSSSTRDDLVHLGIPKDNVKVIRPGIDESLRDFGPQGSKSSLPTIVCIGRFRRYKGFHYAVEAMKYVLREVPTARLILVGNGDESEIRAIVDSTAYGAAIHIVKRKPHLWKEEKRRLLSAAHVLLVPSVKEGYGIVAIEANACGTVSVGWKVAGLIDSILDGQTGVLVPFDDIRQLAHQVSSILLDEKTRTTMSVKAMSWAKSHSWDKASSEFEAVLQSIAR